VSLGRINTTVWLIFLPYPGRTFDSDPNLVAKPNNAIGKELEISHCMTRIAQHGWCLQSPAARGFADW
jgi:hypothetical protein